MISHRWIDNKCVCGVERRGEGSSTRHSKDDFKTYVPYIECLRPTMDKLKIWREKYHANKKPKKNIPDKVEVVYFDMNHVKELLGVKESAIRYWDDRFNLNIKQNHFGVRYFTLANIAMLEKIKELRFIKMLPLEQVRQMI